MISIRHPGARGVVVICANTTWNLANFRSGLIRGMLQAGYRVVAIAPSDRHAERVRALGCELIHLPMDARGLNPFRDAMLAWKFWRVLSRMSPMAFLGFTIKPNVYGSLAAGLARVPAINNIAGLGTTFRHQGWLNRIARVLYRLALRSSHLVFFQNPDDRELFLRDRIVTTARTALLPGSGVDLCRFAPSHAESISTGELVVLLVARLLWDKGIGEFVDAVRQLKVAGVRCDARLMGAIEAPSPAAIPRGIVEAWHAEGIVTYLGEQDDVRPALATADVVVLPSYYREGTPRTLLEAAAMGRPIITTDTPGCRDVVHDGINGYLVPARDAIALADALARFSNCSSEERMAMGRASRQLVETRFDERFVVDAYLAALADIS